MIVISSTCFATLGKMSLTSIPLWPYFWNLNGEPKTVPLKGASFHTSLITLPSYFVRFGLGSNVSTCDGPPWAKIWMTRFAFGAKWGARGASGEVISTFDCVSPAQVFCKSEDKLRAPNPRPHLQRK